MRINKYLAHKGYATRRGADDMIAKGHVFINGRVAVLGDQVEDTDKVEVRRVAKPLTYSYLAYHKPTEEVTPSAKHPGDLFPIGRLDQDSSGLMILTNDGRITDRLLNPDHEHEKEYLVEVRNSLRPSFQSHMEAGVAIGDGVTKPCKIKIMGDREFAVTLTEGKKHQIRRMCAALHNDVVRLKRSRIMNIKLGSLAPSATRAIEGAELKTFLKKLGL